MLRELIPIFTFVTIAFGCFAYLVIDKIRNKRVSLKENEEDFIQRIINKKRKKLDSNLGTITFKTYVRLLVLLPVAIGVICWFTLDDKAMAIILAVVSIGLPDLYIKLTEDKQNKLFQEKYVRALKALSSSLRAGLTIQQAVEDVIKNPFVDRVIKEGFIQIDADIKVGITVEEAFRRFAINSENDDAMDVYSAIAMQNEVGGREAVIIETITNNIQDRIMINKEIKSMFAETMVMVAGFDVLPIIIVLLLYFGAPEFINPYFENSILTIVFAVLVCVMFFGSFFIRKMIQKAKRG